MLGRSFHFVPCHRPELFAKAGRLSADYLVFDLEDGVPAADRAAARNALASHWAQHSGESCLIRINGTDTSDHPADLDLLAQLRPAAVVLPKSESESALATFVSRLRAGRAAAEVLILIETFAGLRNLPKLLAVEGVGAVGLGLEDLLSDHPWPAEDTPELINGIRLQLVFAARAWGVPCVDSISLELSNRDQIEAECRRAKSCGMDGKFSIHPAQVPVINGCFAVTEAELRHAEAILTMCSARENVGYGRIGDEIISPPKVKKAMRIIQFNQKISHAR